ncbi:MAG: hypothetical protein CL714_02310 [Chloroflexi bacterium]|nr:hypothetical protein [Chloroflexota bacterium]|tara:strand:+ start:6947 stop:7777 length:831 start_codon:yes stop_codon:yes gene_type:complete
MQIIKKFVHTGDVAIDIKQYLLDNEYINLVFIHGYSSSKNTWDRVTNELSNCFNITTLDLRGMGRSGRFSDKFTNDVWINDLIIVLEKLFKQKIILIGHSLGGWIATNIASKRPDLVKKLVLVDPYTSAPNDVRKKVRRIPSADIEFRAIRSNKIKSAKTPKDLIIEIKKIYPNASKRSIEILSRMWFDLDHILEKNRIRENINIDKFIQIYKKISCNILFILGSPLLGGIVTKEEKKYIKNLIPDSKFLELKNSGHTPHIEDHINFIDKIKKEIK